MRVIYGSILLIFAAVIVIFCVQNLKSVSVDFLGWNFSLPLPILALLVYVLGMFSGHGLWTFLRRTYLRATAPKV